MKELRPSIWQEAGFWILSENVAIQVMCICFRIAEWERTLGL
jgi:hypothetical protein